MILKVKNWGAVGQVTIDTQKPLLLMCGPNSTGKTYVAYLIYTLFSNMVRSGDFFDLEDFSPEEITESVRKDGYFLLKESHVQSFLELVAKTIKRDFVPVIFAISDDVKKSLFRYFNLDIELSKGQYNRILSVSKEQAWVYMNKITFVFEKVADSAEVRIHISQKENDNEQNNGLRDKIPFFGKMLFSFLMSLIFDTTHDARMLTVERNSIYTFSRELSLTRSGFGDDNLMDLKRPIENRVLQRYPLAVTDSLKIADDLQQIQKGKGDFYDFATLLENNLLKGNIEVNKYGAVEFVPSTKNKTQHHLPIQMTSSIVKTMSSLILYLKHIARKNDLVIIDEPEMNLHPDNQILLARIFAELVNKGLRIVISTHSDYIIREFNNMIMAKEVVNRHVKLEEGEELPYSKSQMLSMRDVGVLYFNIFSTKGKVEGREVDVTEFGFDIASIDQTIKQQNENTHFLSNLLKYGESEE